MTSRNSPHTHPPQFFPSISSDVHTWFWRHNIESKGLLVSSDVVDQFDAYTRSKGSIKKILGFYGMVILDNGAYGEIKDTDPVSVFDKQKKLQPNIAIVLDEVTAKQKSATSHRESVKQTIRNARLIRKTYRGKIKLMGVIQGQDLRLIEHCTKALVKLDYRILGIPMSNYSKRRQYEMAIISLLTIRKNIKPYTILHALGCGSRTMIALLAYFGVRYFDSSSFYKVAMIGKTYEPEQFCSIGKANSRPECAFCLRKQTTPRSYKKRIEYNLIEVQKEIQRTTCALREKRMREYLMSTRLTKSTRRKIDYLLDEA